jgi:hypothetical protein
MNQKLKHLASLIVVAIFIAIAYGSEDEKQRKKPLRLKNLPSAFLPRNSMPTMMPTALPPMKSTKTK